MPIHIFVNLHNSPISRYPFPCGEMKHTVVLDVKKMILLTMMRIRNVRQRLIHPALLYLIPRLHAHLHEDRL